MPITNTLEIARKLEQSGVPARQAEAISEVIEQAVSNGRPDLSRLVTKDDLATLRHEFRAEMRELELRIAERLRSQMLWFFTAQTTLLGIAVVIIKLFP